jgi:hypothetical protein
VEVLAVQVSSAECETVWVPEPESEITEGELVALLTTVTVPVRAPVVAGEKVTLRVAFCPGLRIKPAETPLVANLAFEVLTLEIATLEFPAFVKETLKALVAPMETFPKLRFEILLLSSVVGATPVPLMETLLGLLDALLAIDTVPEAELIALGEKTTLNVD